MIRRLFFLLVLFPFAETNGQVRINLTVQSPHFLDLVSNGHGTPKNPPYFPFERKKDFISPGIEVDNLFRREKYGASLHFAVGAFYSNPAYVGVYQNAGNEFLSELTSSQINIPVLVRGAIKISELIPNNRTGIELGLMGTTWLKYDLQEIASIKIKDASGDIIGETIYSDQGSLIDKPGSKTNVAAMGGMFIYVNRFYVGFRIVLISLGDMYSNRLANSWQVPENYSLFESEHHKGNMKASYATICLSYRITKNLKSD